MRRGYKRRVIVAFWVILLVLLLAWWIGDGIYNPYPPATPTSTPGYWPTRVTATIVPSATPTKVIHTPIQPTIGYTATPTELPVTVTSTPQPTQQPAVTPSATPVTILYRFVRDKDTCTLYIIRPWSIKSRSCGWYPVMRGRFTGSPIFIP